MTSDSEFDFLPAAGQMRLTAIQKAQINRARENAMEELKSVLDRVRLTVDEYTTAEKELQTIESPDPEFEAEQEERKMRERKMKRKERRAMRKMKRSGEEKEEEEEDGDDDDDDEKEKNGRNKQREALDQTTTSGIEEKDGEEGTSPESYGDSSGSSTEEDKDKEDEDTDERETKQETWTVPGQVQRKISQKTLLTVSEKIRGAFQSTQTKN